MTANGSTESGALRIEAANSEAEWNAAADGLDGFTAFHRYDFLSTLAGPLSCRFVPGVVRRGSTAVGIVPQLVRATGPVASLNVMPFPYLGPLVPADLLAPVLDLVRASARRSRVILDWQIFSTLVEVSADSGYTPTTDRTFVAHVDRTDDELLAAMQSRGRAHIRRAESSGVVVEPLQRDDLATAHAWHASLMERQGMPVQYSLEALTTAYDLFDGRPDAFMRAARIDGRLVAAQVTLGARSTTYGWFGLQDPTAGNAQPMAALIWDNLRASRDAGYTTFDFVGAPTKEIATYKAKFGTVERHYTALTRETRSYRVARRAVDRIQWPPSLVRSAEPGH